MSPKARLKFLNLGKLSQLLQPYAAYALNFTHFTATFSVYGPDTTPAASLGHMVPSPRATRMQLNLCKQARGRRGRKAWKEKKGTARKKGTVRNASREENSDAQVIHSQACQRTFQHLSESPCVIPMENTGNSGMCQDQGIAT